MNTKKNSEGQLMLVITSDDLKAMMSEAVNEVINEVESGRLNKKESYLSAEEVSHILNVDLSTLWRWRKKGVITGIKMGGKLRFAQKEIDRLTQKEVSR